MPATAVLDRTRIVAVWLPRLVFLLPAGAAVNVLVAWACVLWAPWPDGLTMKDPVWQRIVPAQWPPAPKDVLEQRSSMLRYTHSQATRLEGNAELAWLEYDLVAGWPLPSVHWTVRARATNHVIGEWNAVGGIPVPKWMMHQKWERGLLPHRPVIPTVIVGSLFYAALLTAAVFGPGTIRRIRRIAHGRCAACNYDLNGIAKDAPCPECGSFRVQKTSDRLRMNSGEDVAAR